MTVVADLHVHTTNSDGTLELEDLPEAARRAGLSAVAVMDHDRVHPGLRASVSTIGGVTVVHGIELRVEADVQAVDLLAEIERLQRDRLERGAAIVERVEARLGLDLGVEPREGLGRPHIARAIAEHPDAPYDVQGAFDKLIGDGGPCYVARDVADADRGIALLREACALVGLAHPLRYDDPEAALELCPNLDAVERYYPYREAVDQTPVERAIAAHDLVATGGSDAHGETVGGAGLDRAAWRRVAARLPAPAA